MAQTRIILDTETTGVDPKRDEILTLSIIADTGDALFDKTFKPARVKSWPEAERVNHISPRSVMFKPGIARYVRQIQMIVDWADVVIAYNADFDVRFLRAAGVRVEQSKVVDTMALYGERAGVWDSKHGHWKWFKLTEAASAIGYTWEGAAHGSLADAKATLAVQRWCESHPRQPVPEGARSQAQHGTAPQRTAAPARRGHTELLTPGEMLGVVRRCSPGGAYSAEDQLALARARIEEENFESRYVERKVYVYNPAPLRGVQVGERITVTRSDARYIRGPIALYDAAKWEGGVALAYHEVPFGAMSAGYPRTRKKEFVVKRVGTYMAHPWIPDMVAYVERKGYTINDPKQFKAKNRKPKGRELSAAKSLEVVGEEAAQEELAAYGEGSWLWLRALPTEVEKGKYKGEPTIRFELGKKTVGTLTAKSAEGRAKLVPPEGAVCLGMVLQGPKKLEVKVLLPEI